jgi:hypothetical protein
MSELPPYHKHLTYHELYELSTGLGYNMYENIKAEYPEFSAGELNDLVSNAFCIGLLCLMMDICRKRDYDNFSCAVYDMLQQNINNLKNE